MSGIPITIVPPETHVRFIHFRTTGMTDPAKTGNNVRLGRTPNGRFYNAMELRFDTTGRRFSGYRFRRTVHEKLWQRVGNEFALLGSLPFGTPDHPGELDVPRTEPPELYDIDMPGLALFAPPSTRTFSWGAGQALYGGPLGTSRETDPSALELILKQQFHEWVEGQTEQRRWIRVSILVDWYSVLRIRRPTPTSNWVITPTTRIARGITAMGNPFDP